jgi:hypothetical protein
VTLVLVTPSGTVQGAGPAPLRGIPQVFSLSPSAAVQSAPQVVPVQPLANQVLSVSLNQQSCTLKLYFREIQAPVATSVPLEPPVFGSFNPLFMDLYVTSSGSTNLIIGGVICQDRNVFVRSGYLGFTGDLSFIDTQGTSDPFQSGLGSRFLLTYWVDL